MMKKLFITLLLFVMIIGVNAQNQNAKAYSYKSGYVKTEYSGNTTGTKEVWWDDHGQKMCEIIKTTSTTKMFGMTSTDETHTMTIFVNDEFWTVDYKDNTGVKGTIEDLEITEGMTEEEIEKLVEESFEQMGGEKLASETIGGYLCDVYTIMGAKSWIHKGTVLKSEAKIMGMEMNEMFVEFKPNASVEASKFVAPKDIEYRDMPQMPSGGFQF